MNTDLTQEQIECYRENGFIVIEDFLNEEELNHWRKVVTEAVDKRKGRALPDRDEVEEDADRTFVDKVFDQLINLWQDNEEIKNIMHDERLGKMAAQLAGVDGVRIWHDQALFKQPWGNPSTLHTDTPYWSFHNHEALSIWVALDDATLQNGCLYFLPGSHKVTHFEPAGFSSDMDELFKKYPELKKYTAVPAAMKAGSCSFHCGLTVHGANANMTPNPRRAMTCAYMPEGSVFNGLRNILTKSQFEKLEKGDLLADDNQNPLLYSKNLDRKNV
ncbi:phytanoyl-CoA dioxygenase family protein [Microbulbifer sp. Q7]|uniref:phytanoyl-CoA dioxygenase family protein n=1 Tax=Microbulbifer sp. Q7 TaxID=1785091 RepID=UPI000832E685|nr:phytanoyl-CoA dioxygenase family protein [Microbulbifer sp. Q7]